MAFKEIAFLLTVFVLGARAELTWYNCDRSAPMQLKSLELKSSYPIQIKPKAVLAARVEYSNRYLATNESKFKFQLQIQKNAGWFGFISIPCLRKIGSCTYEVTCSQIPGCPRKLGSEVVDESFTIPENFKIPGGIFGSLLGSGTYKVRVDVRDASTNERIACGGGQGKINV